MPGCCLLFTPKLAKLCSLYDRLSLSLPQRSAFFFLCSRYCSDLRSSLFVSYLILLAAFSLLPHSFFFSFFPFLLFLLFALTIARCLCAVAVQGGKSHRGGNHERKALMKWSFVSLDRVFDLLIIAFRCVVFGPAAKSCDSAVHSRIHAIMLSCLGSSLVWT
ncbi:hypothetical protein BC826DRAFT_376544 [Russula brevipes]|nr:hypothetical protein BC826DRAFT_376544 [Russula brevipes]